MTNSNAVLAANTVSLGFKLQLAAVWQSNLPIILDRLDRLDEFVAVLDRGGPTPQQRADAQNVAHKFAGSLGMFGYSTGGNLSRTLEHLLEATPTPDAGSVRELVKAIRFTLKL